MALALNQAVAGRWRKDTTRDSLGHPDFDAVAISSSRIAETGSIDVYRLGKSLRKKGFTTAATPDAPSLAEALDDIVADVEATLNGWLASGAPVRVTADDPQLTAVRHWTCELPEGTARLRCGGTHLRSLGELAGISVEATLNDTGDELTVITTPHRAAAS
jgi:alanyl-tRNA synthetase